MRYSRQIPLGDIAIEGQQQLLDSHVLIVGLGRGLGSPAALYLAESRHRQYRTLADDDDVHLSNLQRQILFTPTIMPTRRRRRQNYGWRSSNPR